MIWVGGISMENDNYRIIYIVTDLIMPLVVGYFLNQKHILSDKAANQLIRFNVVGVYTALTLLSFWVLPISWELVMLIPFGMLYVLVPGLIGALTFARRHKNLLNRGAYIMSAMLSNLGTLGGVCAFILYREAGFAYSQIIGTCQNILLVLVCFPLAQYYHSKHTAASHKGIRRVSLREMFISWNQLSLLGIAVGVALNLNNEDQRFYNHSGVDFPRTGAFRRMDGPSSGGISHQFLSCPLLLQPCLGFVHPALCGHALIYLAGKPSFVQ